MDWINSIFAAIATAVVGAFVLLVRKILTSEKKIEVLEKEIATRNEYRLLKDIEINDALDEIRSDIKLLIGKMTRDIRDDR
jgi:hypothetical protein